ncbi:MAG: hypothetical protein ACYDEX_16450 [Mobilitalea sp.]
MEKQSNYIEDIMNRYIYQVTKSLSVQTRNDINEELKTLIYDMIEDRTRDNQPTKEDIQSVLKELGNPSDLAEKYRDKSRFLISPEIFPTYILIMKIVLAATLLGMTIVTILDLLTSSNPIWYEYFGSWFFNLIAAFFTSFSWVTIIFAIFEWRGVNLKKLIPEWEVTSLPPVPIKEKNIPIGEPIAGIILTVLGMILFITSPQLLGVFHIDESLKTIPIFDLEVLQSILPLFAICMGFGILKNIWQIVDRKYSIKYGIFVVIINIIALTLSIIIFTGFPIWNQYFITDINAIYHFGTDNSIASIWDIVTSNFIIFLTLTYLLETATTIYKVLKNENKLFFVK